MLLSTQVVDFHQFPLPLQLPKAHKNLLLFFKTERDSAGFKGEGWEFFEIQSISTKGNAGKCQEKIQAFLKLHSCGCDCVPWLDLVLTLSSKANIPIIL